MVVADIQFNCDLLWCFVPVQQDTKEEWIQYYQVAVYAVAVFLAVVVAFGRPQVSTSLESLINPVLAVLLDATLLDAPLSSVASVRQPSVHRRCAGDDLVMPLLARVVLSGMVVLTRLVPAWLVPAG